MQKKSIKEQEKQWQAESDARTLAMANEILKDRARKSAAIKAAEKIAREAKMQAASAKKMTTKNPNTKKGGKKK